MASQPNILFIILDTQRRDKLSLYGHTVDTSPNLDNFAQNASIFERAVAPAQWTIPAHASLFTGVYPSTHQLTQAYQKLSGAHPTIAEILQVADYETVAFCNNPLLGLLEHDMQRGFNQFFNYSGVSPYRPKELNRHPFARQIADTFRGFAQKVQNEFGRNDFLFQLGTIPLFVPFWSRAINFKGNTENSIGDLIDYWQAHFAGGAEKPLFAFLNLMGTHTPYRPPDNYLDHIAPEVRQSNSSRKFMAQFNAAAAEWLSPIDKPLEDWQSRTMDAYYDAEIAYQDAQLGRLFKFLEQSGQLDDTMVIIAADHGEGHGEHDFMGHSFVVFQELVHVPLFIRYPERFPAGKHIQTNVSTRRLFHTILDVTDIPAPLAEDDPNADIRGLSLISALNGRPDTERGIAFSEAFPPTTLLSVLERDKPHLVESKHLTWVRRGVYHGDHKLAMVGNEIDSLFNIAADPSENANLADAQPELVHELREKVVNFVEDAKEQRMDTVSNGTLNHKVIDNLRALGYID